MGSPPFSDFLYLHLVNWANLGKLLKLSRTDIEQEVNGLYYFARDASGKMTPNRTEKIDADRVKSIIRVATQVYFDRISGTKR